ncbi:MAG: mitochondrial fission ELM1 family protein [Pseudomonadota bacterium]
MKIWALSDGRAGNVAQAMALAEAFGRRQSVEITAHDIMLSPWAAALPAPVLHGLGLGARGVSPALRPPWPDLVISAGRRSAPLAAWLRRTVGIPVVQILDPKLPAGMFSALVRPRHDGREGAEVIATTGSLSRLTPQAIEEAGSAWSPPETVLQPYVAVLLGGPSKSAGFDEGGLRAALAGLTKTYGLVVTPSRRTPEHLSAAIRADLGVRGYVWDGTGANPYPALLHCARAVLVTADSVNMTSEAASTGKPIHVLGLDTVSGKIARFHQGLIADWITRPFNGQIEHWSYAPLAEADRVAGMLERQLGLGQTGG